MDDELEGCIADARIATSAAHDHLTRIEERARKVRAEIETTVRAAVQREMRERIATARREGAEAMRERCAKACRTVATLDTLSEVRPALYLEGRRRGADLCADAIRALGAGGVS